jgi:hypothetical protein
MTMDDDDDMRRSYSWAYLDEMCRRIEQRERWWRRSMCAMMLALAVAGLLWLSVLGGWL